MTFSLPTRRPSLPTLIFGGLFLAYCIAFYLPIREAWFNPDWATDDSMQQIYPFHKVQHPQLFAGDLITKMMECYLAPLHYWLSWAITWITGDPIMMGHWVMLLQLVSALVFVFLAVRHAAGTFPAFFACTWFLHTRHMVQRMTGGLPRGWSPTVLGAFLYFAISGNHYGVLATLLVGCLLHTPSTLIAALAYGLLLLWKVLRPETRAEYRPHLVRLLLVSPLCIILAVSVVKMPEDIGTMATLERAEGMVEFQKPGGRFPFLPFPSVRSQLETFGFQAFVGKFSSPVSTRVKRLLPELVTGLLVVCALVAWKKRIAVMPPVLWMFLISSLSIYGASRLMAFRLYVPDRHLQIPLAMFFIVGLSIAARRLLARASEIPSGDARWSVRESLRAALPGLACFIMLGSLIYAGSGSGLQGAMNFNTWRTKRGEVWTWLKEHTPQDAVVAGHPTFVDPVMLFGMRQGYVTTETTHPFYDKYYDETRRRTAIALRAHFARNWEDFLSIVGDEKIDYFVFQRSAFKPLRLRSTTYFPPFRDIVAEVSSRGPSQFAYLRLPPKAQMDSFPPLVFVDNYSKVIDVAALRAEVLK
jgi:hypothetical protein